jgi:hypothetical protein
MPITGLLLTLSQEPRLQREALGHLQTRPELQIGTAIDRWVPVALAAEDDAHCRELHDWILSSAGVEYVDVVCVNFEEEVGGAASPSAI